MTEKLRAQRKSAALCVPDLGNERYSAVRFTIRPIYSRGNCLRYHWTDRWL